MAEPQPTGKLFGISTFNVSGFDINEKSGISGKSTSELVEGIFEKTDFRNSLHDLGLGKPVTGSQILGNIQAIYFDESIGVGGAYLHDSRPINLAGIEGQTLPRSIIFNPHTFNRQETSAHVVLHEMGHSARFFVDPDYATKVQESLTASGYFSRTPFTTEHAKMIGAEEGGADRFAQSMFKKAGLEPVTSFYGTLDETLMPKNLELLRAEMGDSFGVSDLETLRENLKEEGILDERPGLAQQYLRESDMEVLGDPLHPKRDLYNSMRDSYNKVLYGADEADHYTRAVTAAINDEQKVSMRVGNVVSDNFSARGAEDVFEAHVGMNKISSLPVMAQESLATSEGVAAVSSSRSTAPEIIERTLKTGATKLSRVGQKTAASAARKTSSRIIKRNGNCF